MAHFAELDKNNMVLRVVVIANDKCLKDGLENEATGIAFCERLFKGGTWKQTSYNSNFRYNYAGIGDTYDAELDAFIKPRPYPSWLLDKNCQWQPPVAMPDDGGQYFWDEDGLVWTEE